MLGHLAENIDDSMKTALEMVNDNEVAMKPVRNNIAHLLNLWICFLVHVILSATCCFRLPSFHTFQRDLKGCSMVHEYDQHAQGSDQSFVKEQGGVEFYSKKKKVEENFNIF